jgi:transposase
VATIRRSRAAHAAGVLAVIRPKMTHSVGRFASAAAFAAHVGTAPIPASSGRVVRHRLARGGNRQLNRALFTVAMCQARWDPAGRACLARKRTEPSAPSTRHHGRATGLSVMRPSTRLRGMNCFG